jgi:hypothetical protein
VSFTTRPLYSGGKSPQYTLDRRLGGPKNRSGRGGEEKQFRHCPLQELNPGRPPRILVTILSELPRFSHKYVGHKIRHELEVVNFQFSLK